MLAIRKKKEILDFINRRFKDTDAHWFDGNCYYFTIILKTRFPELQIYYEPIEGHFVAGFKNTFFDAHGEYISEYKPLLFEELCKEDPCLEKQLIKDCIK